MSNTIDILYPTLSSFYSSATLLNTPEFYTAYSMHSSHPDPPVPTANPPLNHVSGPSIYARLLVRGDHWEPR